LILARPKGYFRSCIGHDLSLFWILHRPLYKAILRSAHDKIQGNLGRAPGFCTLNKQRLFWVPYLRSCIQYETKTILGPATCRIQGYSDLVLARTQGYFRSCSMADPMPWLDNPSGRCRQPELINYN
jgi:hypothetical protein